MPGQMEVAEKPPWLYYYTSETRLTCSSVLHFAWTKDQQRLNNPWETSFCNRTWSSLLVGVVAFEGSIAPSWELNASGAISEPQATGALGFARSSLR
ncbi:hypothetical protein TRIATDRAFT_298112 [Trichoderma atroviride IMI 206040]|uniref:Uncharacterized protein n=1 Tax=Hypocrea atroviridis (strain ATCC 20476 / IMI 206040) TaxID=452589 RepID=G9NLI4_HYPAI|nr:uncharacterized protein TRIATDRAFT_298112 [Trichoderma atroviride IMI 206040]EHK48746.1 hypothetical protein TRIATDRAFT_298112 [Trichoderma atroviride IMI 206040]